MNENTKKKKIKSFTVEHWQETGTLIPHKKIQRIFRSAIVTTSTPAQSINAVEWHTTDESLRAALKTPEGTQ